MIYINNNLVNSKFNKNFLSSEEKIKQELLELYTLLGKENFNYKHLRSSNRYIINAIERYSNKNLKQLCDELNLDHTIIGNTYKKGYWKKESNILKEVEKFYNQAGFENFNYEYMKNNYGELFNGIRRSSKNLGDYANQLNLKHSITPKNYYKDLSNINYEIYKLVEKYGFFPSSRELLSLEKMNGLVSALKKFHNVSLKTYVESLGVTFKSNTSMLERYVKLLLDEFILDKEYIDNARTDLFKYGINLTNPETGRCLQLDRYYIKAKVAIEIQGEQHYKPTKLWDESRVNSCRKLDQIKRQLLKEQNIYLLEIPYNRIGRQTIYKLLKESAVLKLCETEKV